MKNKKKGFTILELIISLTITVVVLGVVFSIFILSTKIFSNVNINSDLQIEAQKAGEKISIAGMQAIKIDSITLENGQIENFGIDGELNYIQLSTLLKDIDGKDLKSTAKDNEKYLNISQIKIITKEEIVGSDPIQTKEVSYTITYVPTSDRDSDKTKHRGTLKIKKGNEPTQILGEDIENITIKPSDTLGKLSQADSIQININLAEKKGFSDIKYSIPINITFRNKWEIVFWERMKHEGIYMGGK